MTLPIYDKVKKAILAEAEGFFSVENLKMPERNVVYLVVQGMNSFYAVCGSDNIFYHLPLDELNATHMEGEPAYRKTPWIDSPPLLPKKRPDDQEQVDTRLSTLIHGLNGRLEQAHVLGLTLDQTKERFGYKMGALETYNLPAGVSKRIEIEGMAEAARHFGNRGKHER